LSTVILIFVMTSIPAGYEPGLGSGHRSQEITGAEPQLGGSKRLNMSIVDYLSRGLWTSVEELRRVARHIPRDLLPLYRDALIARLGLVEPGQPLPRVNPYRGGRDQRVRIIDSLSIIGDEHTVTLLQPLINDENAQLRQTTMVALGRLGSPKAIPTLTSVLRQPDRGVYDRAAAVDALALLCHSEAVPPLLKAFPKETSSVVLRKMCNALGYTADERALPVLIDGLRESDDPLVRADAAQAIGRLGVLRGTLYLVEALEDEDEGVRLASVLALSRLKNEISRAGLTFALSDSSAKIRDTARSMLRVLSDSLDQKTRRHSRRTA